MTSGIYRVYCVENDTSYIGQSYNIGERFSQHRCHLRKGTHPNKHLQSAWRKYGEVAFRFEVLEMVDDPTLRDAAEQRTHDRFAASGCRLFNKRETTESNKGLRHSESTKRKIREGAIRQFSTQKAREQHSLSYRNGQPILLLSPNGKSHEIRNLTEFCAERGLLLSSMAKLAKGRLLSYKGWTNPSFSSSDKKSRKLTESQKQEIVRRYEQGENTVTLSAEYGVSSQSLGAMLKRRGVEMRHPNPKPKGVRLQAA